MDADGNVLAKLSGAPTVSGFDGMMKQAAKTDGELRTLGKKAEAGDKTSMAKLLAKKIELGYYNLKQAKAEVEKIGKIEDKAVAKDLDGWVVGLEVEKMMNSIHSRAEIPKLTEKFVAMWKEGRVPNGNGMAAVNFCGLVFDHALKSKNKKLASEALDALAKRIGDNPRAKKWVEAQREKVEKLDG